MTLRLRLLLVLVVIVAGGLLISDVVTYASLQSFLITRFDQQLRLATFPVERALIAASASSPPSTSPGPVSPSTRPPVGGSTGARHGLGAPRRALARGLLVPPGTFGEIRNASGAIVDSVYFTYGSKAPAAPVAPSMLPGSGMADPSARFFTTSSTGHGATAYRAVARPLPSGNGTIIIFEPLAGLNSTLQRLFLIEVIVSGLVLAVLGSVAWVIVRRGMRPLEAMAGTAAAIAAGDLSQRVSDVSPGTEVGRLGLAFNAMVREIEEAFAARAASEERLRRFLADASHELRTPLTSIRGYAELFDLGVSERPADLAISMHHIKGEAARMSTLVDDLFMLARLDHERPLTRGPVDLASTVADAVASARISAPDRLVRFTSNGAVVVLGDKDRIRQVIDNLVTNALTHTPADASIDVSVGTEAGWATLTVHDTGPGIDASEAARIFEPFYRSDPSRTRSTGGAGLGLAIVWAIAVAHGGGVEVVPGPEATFVVRLPLAEALIGGIPSVPHDNPTVPH